VRRGAWQRVVTLDGARSWIDLRDAGAAAAERTTDWQVELSRANGTDQLFLYLAAGDDPGPLIDIYEDLKRIRSAPTQIVLTDPFELQARRESAPGPWPRFWIKEERATG
jgi:hypothetical protein